MQKKNLKPGVLYGYATGTSEYRTASPVIVLDVEQLWTWSRNNARGDKTYKVSNRTKPAKSSSVGGYISYHGDDGYLTLSGSDFGDAEDKAATLAAMTRLAEWFSTTARDADAVEALRQRLEAEDVVGAVGLEIVNNRWIEGEYANAKNEEQARSEARNAQWDADRRKTQRESALVEAMHSALRARGVVGHLVVKTEKNNFGRGHRVSVPADVLAQLLGVETEESS